MRTLELDLRPERFAVIRLARDAEIPWWVESSAFFSVTRTDSEVSIVCDETAVPHADESRGGLRCLAVRGPLGFSEVGVLSSLARPLAEAEISIFTISSFATDYVFVSDDVVEKAVGALEAAGHVIKRRKPR